MICWYVHGAGAYGGVRIVSIPIRNTVLIAGNAGPRRAFVSTYCWILCFSSLQPLALGCTGCCEFAARCTLCARVGASVYGSFRRSVPIPVKCGAPRLIARAPVNLLCGSLARAPVNLLYSSLGSVATASPAGAARVFYFRFSWRERKNDASVGRPPTSAVNVPTCILPQFWSIPTVNLSQFVADQKSLVLRAARGEPAVKISFLVMFFNYLLVGTKKIYWAFFIRGWIL